MRDLRRRLFLQLDLHGGSAGETSLLNRFIMALILVSVAYVILSTEVTLVERWPSLFFGLDIAFAVLFTLEYLLRLWCITERSEFTGLRGRLRYAATPRALIDLLAIVPFYLSLGMTESFLLRLFRLLRMVSLAKFSRYTAAMDSLKNAIAERRYELLVSLGAAMLVLLAAATVLYAVEGRVQPEHFGSIPRALWWGVATLTTVGYGDVFPITPLGKLFAGMTALAAVGTVAMPAGILAAAFSEAFQQRRREAERLRGSAGDPN